MLGSTVFRQLAQSEALNVYGSVRSTDKLVHEFTGRDDSQLITGIDVSNPQLVEGLLIGLSPDVVINCVGIIKQDPSVDNRISTISLNSSLPHALSDICAQRGIRLVHISTDCVFSGSKGGYVETDTPDPKDFYGRSKLLGEVTDAPALTLRTSIIGHELASNRSLLDWFLSQSGTVQGYSRAIYSGLTTTEFAHMLETVVIPRDDLHGLYHVASSAISKFELLKTIAKVYDWRGQLVPFAGFVCDRSLSAGRLFSETGYQAPNWPTMIADMRQADYAGRSTR